MMKKHWLLGIVLIALLNVFYFPQSRSLYYARPDSDVTTGNWTSTPLYQDIDEEVANDSDYVESERNPTNDVFEVGLTDLSEPPKFDGFTIRVRAKTTKNAGTFVFGFYQGASLIASQTPTLTTSFQTFELLLTEEQAQSITDYTDLRVRCDATTSGNSYHQVSWIEFEISASDQPDFPLIYIDADAGDGGVGSQADPYNELSDINWTTGGDNSVFDYLDGTPSQSPTIYLAEGDEWREQLTVGTSGTATYPIVLDSYGSGADPIINGFNLISTWTARTPLEETGGIFNSGFEDEVDAMTTDFDGKTEAGSNTITIGTTPVHGGADNATCAFDGTNLNCYAHKVFAQQSDTYVRAYVRRNSTSECTDNYSYWPILVLRDASTRSVMLLHARPAATTTTWGFYCTIKDTDGAATAIHTGASDFAVDTWYCVEMRYLVDDTVGGGQLWIDGVSKGSNFTKDTSGQDVDTVRVGGNSEDAWNGVPTSGSEIYIDDAVVDSSAIGAATVYRTNTWGATDNTEPEFVYFDGTRGSNVASLDLLDTANEWFWAGNILYCYATSDPDNLSSPGVEAATRNFQIKIDGKSYITIDGLELKGANYVNLWLHSSAGALSNIIIQNCKIWKGYRFGIWGNASGTNTITDVTISDNELSYCGGNGVLPGAYCNTWTISDNTVHHNCIEAAIDGSLEATGGIRISPDGNTAHTIIVENNTVYSNGYTLGGTDYRGKGIWVDTAGANIIVRYNESYDNHNMGIILEDQDNTEVYYNLCYGNGGHGIAARKGSDSNEIYNNVCYDNIHGLEVNGLGGTAASNLIKNNISINNSSCELSAVDGGENPAGNGNVYEYNCFGAEAANFIEWGATNYDSTYDDWETSYGSGTNSVEADPLMTDPANNDFTLQKTSPCRDAGTDVGLTQDYRGSRVPKGSAPDIGAYEYFKAIIWQPIASVLNFFTAMRN